METDCETYIPTQQTGAQTPPWVQKPHGDDEWPQNSGQPPRKGSGTPFGVVDFMCATHAAHVKRTIAPSLKNSADFQRITRQGKKWAFPSFIMQALKREDTESSFRLGLTVSRKVGNAVTRNRAKRRLREIVRLYETPEKLSGWDIVLIGRASAAERDFSLMRQDFLQGLRNMGVET